MIFIFLPSEFAHPLSFFILGFEVFVHFIYSKIEPRYEHPYSSSGVFAIQGATYDIYTVLNLMYALHSRTLQCYFDKHDHGFV